MVESKKTIHIFLLFGYIRQDKTSVIGMGVKIRANSCIRKCWQHRDCQNGSRDFRGLCRGLGIMPTDEKNDYLKK